MNIIFNFVIFVATQKGRATNFISALPFVAVFGSGIRDGQKSGSGINIPDPPH
jgi:predicted nucleotidyltransferase